MREAHLPRKESWGARTRASLSPAPTTPWGMMGHQVQGDGDRGDSYAVIADPRGPRTPNGSSEKRAKSVGWSDTPPSHGRRSCDHESSSSEEGSDHSSMRYQRFNRDSCRRDEVKVRVGDFKGGMDALALPMFLIEFEEASMIAGWSYPRKGQELRTRLKGPALMAVHSLTEDGTSTDFNALSKALCAEFLPPSATVRAHMQLNSCVQGDKSVTAYGEHLRRLAMLAYLPGSPEGQAAVCDRRALDRFVVTLKAGELRVKVLEGKPRSLSQAVNIAEEYAAIMDPHGDGTNLPGAVPTYQVQGVPAPQPCPAAPAPRPATDHECTATKAVQELSRSFNRAQGREQGREGARGGQRKQGPPRTFIRKGNRPPGIEPVPPNRKCDSICYRCQKKGHFARECGGGAPQAASVSCMEGICCNGAPHICLCASCHFPVTELVQGDTSCQTSPNA